MKKTPAKAFLVRAVLAGVALGAFAQAPGVPVYEDGAETRGHADLTNGIAAVRESGQAITMAAAREQLRRPACRLTLPAPNREKLASREIWERARRSHLRIGWSYMCITCDQWHLTLAGGYALTTNGAVAASYHVIEPERDMRKGNLVAVDEAGKVFPVTEVLAANRYSDTCIVQAKGNGFVPLPLNTNVCPGDVVYCLSDPLGRQGYFSRGSINRFFHLPAHRLAHVPGAPLFAPTWMHVDTDWAPGSSGAAVLDECGNAVGQVATISATGEDEPSATGQEKLSTLMVFHSAVSARDVLALVREK